MNFGVVPGDALFAGQPRNTGANLACPDPSVNVQATGSFAISPMDPGSYVLQGFYDYTGDFLATFKIRNLPMATDVGGGFVDINDATSLETVSTTLTDAGTTVVTQQQKQKDPNYLPTFLPVDVGIPGPVPAGSVVNVPSFTMPDTGFVADNIVVTLGTTLRFARPYFYPSGYQSLLADGGVAPPALQANPDNIPNPPPVITVNPDSSQPGPGTVTDANPDGNPTSCPSSSSCRAFRCTRRRRPSSCSGTSRPTGSTSSRGRSRSSS